MNIKTFSSRHAVVTYFVLAYMLARVGVAALAVVTRNERLAVKVSTP